MTRKRERVWTLCVSQKDKPKAHFLDYYGTWEYDKLSYNVAWDHDWDVGVIYGLNTNVIAAFDGKNLKSGVQGT